MQIGFQGYLSILIKFKFKHYLKAMRLYNLLYIIYVKTIS